MQPAKDSFYLALRDRLAALDATRTVLVDGQARPAVLVQENEPVTSAAPFANAYYLSWGAPQVVARHDPRPLMQISCEISYRTAGTLEGGVERGRALGALDTELLRLLSPPRTPKCDHAHTPPLALGTNVFWGSPAFQPVEAHQSELRRSVRLAVFFVPEVVLS